MSIDAAAYRRVVGEFATGVSVVTTAVDGRLHGTTVNSLTSVSLDPLLLLICIDRKANAHRELESGERFAVNILTAEQEELSHLFAESNKPELGRLQGVPYRIGPHGTPVLEDCLAYLECEVSGQYPGGDHTIFMGAVLGGETLREDAPLLFHRGSHGRVDP